jgi:hypothetical protein
LEECHIASSTGKQLELRESNGSSASHGAISNVQNEGIPEYNWALDHLQFISYRALGVPDRRFTNILKRSFELDPERYVKGKCLRQGVQIDAYVRHYLPNYCLDGRFLVERQSPQSSGEHCQQSGEDMSKSLPTQAALNTSAKKTVNSISPLRHMTYF